MADKNTDFLKFNAYSIKELIKQKLASDTRFTDQLYEGSNISLLINLVSYMYQCLMYNLNNAASESMFSDTQIYENINRLVNLIGYHPRGYIPSSLNLYLIPQASTNGNVYNSTILPFSYIDTGLTDKRGKKICFSINEQQSVTTNYHTVVNLVNGRWKLYGTIFTANGIDYETFLLDGLRSDHESEEYVANEIIVFVESIDENGNTTITKWTRDDNELFVQSYANRLTIDGNEDIQNNSLLYTPDFKVFSSRLNQDKTYEIKFGNGITGKRLKKGDRIYVMYLDTNGPEGKITLDDVDISNLKFKNSPTEFGLSEELYQKMFNLDADIDSITKHLEDEYVLSMPFPSTTPKNEDGVEDIREKAPTWFKTGNRLITKADYEYYMKNSPRMENFGIIDVKCMNNWDYMVSFYRWLYNLGLNSKDKPGAYKYLQKQRLVQYGYQFVDSADANNIYIWTKLDSDDTTGEKMEQLKVVFDREATELKTMTTEVYIQQPVTMMYDISFTPDDLYYNNLTLNDDTTFDTAYSYLEITMSDNSVYNSTSIKTSVAKIILNAFQPEFNNIGKGIDYQSIMNNIYNINGVERVRTVFYIEPEYVNNNPELNQYQSRYCDGIAFASWTSSSIINKGDDLVISNNSRNVEQFHFPQLIYDNVSTLSNKIKVIRKSMNNSNPVKF